ncbi:MAG TPA: redox-sensing transcriptional repressor Rex [Pseudonocardia sp.]|nr:redox-sensing transcriptional repressor Rex [Pseudonocardia sp.]
MTLHPQADPSGEDPVRELAAKLERAIPEATVARLAVYLRVLGDRSTTGSETVSSEDLAAAAGVNSAKLRKDLSYIGSNGTRGVGYEVTRLVHQIEHTLGLTQRHAVALVGVGNLGHALAGYSGFAGRGFPLRALFDVDPDLVGIHIAGILVEHIDRIAEVCVQRGVTIGVIATPGSAAQAVCNQLVGAGVRSILNFAPAVLQVPEEVEVRKVDLAVEMQILSFHVARRHGEPALNGAILNSSNGIGSNGIASNGIASNGAANGSVANGSAHSSQVVGASVNGTANGSVNGSVNGSGLSDPVVSADGGNGRAVLPQ